VTDDARKDALYAQPRDEVTGFVLDERVAAVFPDMIRRSVPGYATIVSVIGVLTGRLAQPDSRCYDLGCSHGASMLAMRRAIEVPGVRIVAVDNSPAMIAKCRQYLAQDDSPTPVDLVCGDVRDPLIRDASVVVLNFMLQFIPPAERTVPLRGVAECPHGDPPRWRRVLEALPVLPADRVALDASRVTVSRRSPLDAGVRRRMIELLQGLHPWRKGPYQVHGVVIDAAWMSRPPGFASSAQPRGCASNP
jgi:SAM-dependent methyltransferase